MNTAGQGVWVSKSSRAYLVDAINRAVTVLCAGSRRPLKGFEVRDNGYSAARSGGNLSGEIDVTGKYAQPRTLCGMENN